MYYLIDLEPIFDRFQRYTDRYLAQVPRDLIRGRKLTIRMFYAILYDVLGHYNPELVEMMLERDLVIQPYTSRLYLYYCEGLDSFLQEVIGDEYPRLIKDLVFFRYQASESSLLRLVFTTSLYRDRALRELHREDERFPTILYDYRLAY